MPKPALLVIACVLVAVMAAGAYGYSLLPAIHYSCAAHARDRDIATREEALECAPETYKNAVAQGVPLQTIPCIYGDRNWSVIVDLTGRRTFRQSVRLCGGRYPPGTPLPHAVVFDRDGHLRFAR